MISVGSSAMLAAYRLLGRRCCGRSAAPDDVRGPDVATPARHAAPGDESDAGGQGGGSVEDEDEGHEASFDGG
jgi:hypothetical protein